MLKQVLQFLVSNIVEVFFVLAIGFLAGSITWLLKLKRTSLSQEVYKAVDKTIWLLWWPGPFILMLLLALVVAGLIVYSNLR